MEPDFNSIRAQRKEFYFREERRTGFNGNGGTVFISVTPPKHGQGYYFRAVTEDEYEQLVKTGTLAIANSYQGISSSFQYTMNYFGNGAGQSKHIVEFKVIDPAIQLEEEFRYAGTGSKIENGALSWGLGSRATPVRAGVPANGGAYFMECLKAKMIRWRLVKFIGKNLPDVTCG